MPFQDAAPLEQHDSLSRLQPSRQPDERGSFVGLPRSFTEGALVQPCLNAWLGTCQLSRRLQTQMAPIKADLSSTQALN